MPGNSEQSCPGEASASTTHAYGVRISTLEDVLQNAYVLRSGLLKDWGLDSVHAEGKKAFARCIDCD